MEIQSSVFTQCQKTLLCLEITAPPNVKHSIIYNLSLSNLTFIHVFNNLKVKYINNKIMKHKSMMNYAKNNRTRQHEQQQNQLGKLFIGNLNVNVITNYI